MVEAPLPGRRQPLELDGEEEDEEDAEEELRHGEADEAEEHADAVDDASRAQRGDHPERDRDQHGEGDAGEDQLERRREMLEHDPDRRPVLQERRAEVALREISDVLAELRQDGPVEADLVPERGTLRGRRLERQHHLDRVAHEPGRDEHDHGHAEDDDEALDDPPDRESAHPDAPFVLPYPASFIVLRKMNPSLRGCHWRFLLMPQRPS